MVPSHVFTSNDACTVARMHLIVLSGVSVSSLQNNCLLRVLVLHAWYSTPSRVTIHTTHPFGGEHMTLAAFSDNNGNYIALFTVYTYLCTSGIKYQHFGSTGIEYSQPLPYHCTCMVDQELKMQSDAVRMPPNKAIPHSSAYIVPLTQL